MSRHPHFPMFHGDFISSCRKRRMKPEDMAAYFVFLCMQWEAQGPIHLDAESFAGYSGWSLRLSRRLCRQLLAFDEKIVRQHDDGRVSNARMESEIERYVNKVRAYQEREERKAERDRDIQNSSSNSKLVSNYLGTKNEIVGKKPNEIKQGQRIDGIKPEPEPEPIRQTLGQSDLIDRMEAGSKPDRAKPRPKPTDQQFSAFWDAYPRRVKKAEARKKFMVLQPEAADLAIAGARSYAREVAADGRDPSKVMHPTTYLNQRVFEDLQDADADCAAPDPVNGKAWGFWRAEREQWAKYSPEAWRAALDKAKPNGTWPWWQLGPPPGHRECLVHPTVVEERGLADVYRGKISHHD